jgi:hypothetical protein
VFLARLVGRCLCSFVASFAASLSLEISSVASLFCALSLLRPRSFFHSPSLCELTVLLGFSQVRSVKPRGEPKGVRREAEEEINDLTETHPSDERIPDVTHPSPSSPFPLPKQQVETHPSYYRIPPYCGWRQRGNSQCGILFFLQLPLHVLQVLTLLLLLFFF